MFKKLFSRWSKSEPQSGAESDTPSASVEAEITAADKTDVSVMSMSDRVRVLDVAALQSFINTDNVNETDADGRTALYYAVRFNRADVVAFLLAAGARSETVSETPLTPRIDIFIEQKNSDILKLFLDNGLLLPRLHKLVPLMHSAVASGCGLDFLRLFMSHGVSLESHDGSSVLATAIESNATADVIDWLMETDTHSVAIGKSAENIAEVIIGSAIAADKKAELLHQVFTRSSDLIKRPLNGEAETLLELAITIGQPEVVKTVIKHGADFSPYVDQLYRLLEKADVDEIVDSASAHNMKQAYGLMSYATLKVAIETDKRWQATPLILDLLSNQRLSASQRQELVAQAIAAGADVNMDRQGETALYYVCAHIGMSESTELLETLLKAGAKTEFSGRSALFVVLGRQNKEAITLLLEHGADVNFVDDEKRSLANYLVTDVLPKQGEIRADQIVRECLNYGLDVSVCSEYFDIDETVEIDMFSIFACHDCQEIISSLLDAGARVKTGSNLVYYVIRFVPDLNVQLRVIATNPEYRYPDFYANGERKDYAEAIGIAVFFKREQLVNRLLDLYPDMKTYNRVRNIYSNMIEKGISVATIKRLIARDPDINRRYTYVNSEGEDYRFTASVSTAKTISSDDYSYEKEQLELLEYMFEIGADPDVGEQFPDSNIDSLSIFCVTANPDRVHRPLFDLLIRYGADPRAKKGSNNESSIHTITQRLPKMSDEGIVSHLEYFDEKTGIDLEERNKLETNLLLGAAMNCKPKTVAWLLAKGADIHARGGHDNAPVLHKAISNYPSRDAVQRAKTVEVLIQHGADVDGCDAEEASPLMHACYFGAYLSVKVLLENGADANYRTQDGHAAINQAVIGKYSFDYHDQSQLEYVKGRIVQALHEYGADINNVSPTAETPLIATIRLGRRHLFSTLLKCGADINVGDAEGLTPLMYAIREGEVYFVNALLNNENINAHAKSANGQDAFSCILLRKSTNEALAILDVLVHWGVKPGRYSQGDTLAHMACLAGNEQLLEAVVEAFPQLIHQTNELGQSVIMYAVLSRYLPNDSARLRIIQWLASKGADINAVDQDGYTAMLHCMLIGNLNLALMLLEEGVDVSIRTEYGETLLHLLLRTNISDKERLQWIARLTEAGVDVNISDGVDVCLLAAIKHMDFVANPSIGFVSAQREISRDEEALVDTLIRYGADVNIALRQAEEQQLSSVVSTFLKSKLA